MSSKIEINGICERDLDLFLQEQLISSDHFCIWFAEKAGLSNVLGAASPALRGKTDRTGESDLEVTLDVGRELPFLLLVENKITAQFQPMQAERYQDRGRVRIEEGRIVDFMTVLVSPERYFRGDSKNFDCRISFEEIRAYLASTDSELTGLSGSRCEYKLSILAAAINRFNSGTKDRGTAFTNNYWTLINEIAPEFNREKLPPEKGDTMHFVDSRPAPNILASHRLAQGKFGSKPDTCKQYGNFDILIESSVERIEEIRKAFEGVLLPHIMIVDAGQSVAFRIAVPQILKADRIEGPGEIAAARTAIYLGKDLYNWFLTMRQIWQQFVKPR